MARYRVMSWRGIPSQVKATDDSGATAARMLPNRWQQEIDKVAMPVFDLDRRTIYGCPNGGWIQFGHVQIECFEGAGSLEPVGES